MFVLAKAQKKGPEKHQILIASIGSPTVRCCLLAQAEPSGRWRPVTQPSTPVKSTCCECFWAPNLRPHLGPNFGPCNKDSIKRPQKRDPKTDPKMGPRNAIVLVSKTLHSKRCPSSFWPTACRMRLGPHCWGPEVRSQVLDVFAALKKEPRTIPTTRLTTNPSPHKTLSL